MLSALQFSRKLDTLCFAARKLCRWLTEPQIAETDLAEHRKWPRYLALTFKESARFIDGHVQHLRDVPAVPFDLKRLGIVATSTAGRGRRGDTGQTQKLDHDKAFPFAGRATPIRHIEGEASGVVTAAFGGRRRGEDLSYMIEKSAISREIRTRRSSNWLLVHLHNTPDVFHTTRYRAFSV